MTAIGIGWVGHDIPGRRIGDDDGAALFVMAGDDAVASVKRHRIDPLTE